MATATCKQENSDIFTCPICFDIIISPKSLPCLHSFCEQCICKYIVTLNTKETEQIKNYPCPVCRTVITPTNPEVDVSKWAALLPTNFTLNSLMDSTNNKEEQECNLCKRRSQSSIGIFWCLECMERLCQNCSDYHSSVKSLVNHKVTKIEHSDAIVLGIDLNAINEICSVHSAKYTEVFCFDHKKLCCVLCLTLEHRKCENVKAVSEKDKAQIVPVKTIIKTTESTLEKLISGKQNQIDQFDVSIKTVEAKASKLVANIKDKLDRLLLSFTKELSLLGDGERCKLEDELNVLSTFLENVRRMSEVTSLVSDHGSAIQQYINRENVTSQIRSSILESIQNFKCSQAVRMELFLDSVLENVDNLSGLGKLSVVNSDSQFLENISENIMLIQRHIRSLPVEIIAKFKKVVRIPGNDFTCGVSISDSMVICGNYTNRNLVSIDLVTEAIKHSDDYYYVKRITVNAHRNKIYVAYMNGYFRRYSFDLSSGFNRELHLKSLHLGGVTLFENDIYIIVENTIRKFSADANFKSVDAMVKCFESNTDCSNDVLNGLAIDPKNNRLIYTSKDKEIICKTLKGKYLFCVQDTTIQNPTSVTVHSCDIILVGSETGSVHAITSDGKNHYILIEKCQNITRLCDIWLDQKEETLFLCGGEHIEMYDISIEKVSM